MSKINKRQIVEAGDTSGWAIDANAHTYSTTQTLLTVTMTSAPPGDYAIDAGCAITPSGSGNCSISPTMSGSTGTFTTDIMGCHASDADFSVTKFLHRHSSNRLSGHPGGTFTITLVFSPESAVNFVFGNAADARWASYLRVTKVG